MSEGPQSQNPYAPPTAVSPAPKEPPSAKPFSLLATVILSVFVPGLPLLMMKHYLSGLILLFLIPVAFIFFGPIWGVYLFAGTPYTEDGLYPFLCVLVTTPVVSLIHSVHVRGNTTAVAAANDGGGNKTKTGPSEESAGPDRDQV